MDEVSLGEFHVEPWGTGFILAHYQPSGRAQYAGRDMLWRRQPMGFEPFATAEDATATLRRTYLCEIPEWAIKLPPT